MYKDIYLPVYTVLIVRISNQISDYVRSRM